ESDPWSGHIALPGGRRHPEDEDLLATAMRETAEETAVPLARIGRLLGALDEVEPTNPRLPPIIIAPFVLGVAPDTTAVPDPREVEAALWVPLDALRDPGAVSETLIELESGQRRAFPSLRYGEHVIWGLTPRILPHFMRIAEERGLRGPASGGTEAALHRRPGAPHRLLRHPARHRRERALAPEHGAHRRGRVAPLQDALDARQRSFIAEPLGQRQQPFGQGADLVPGRTLLARDRVPPAEARLQPVACGAPAVLAHELQLGARSLRRRTVAVHRGQRPRELGQHRHVLDPRADVEKAELERRVARTGADVPRDGAPLPLVALLA